VKGQALECAKTSTGKLLVRRNALNDGSNAGAFIDGNYIYDFELIKYFEDNGYGTVMISAYGESALTVEAFGKFPAGTYLATN
jgi:hypothetical protein